MAGWTPSSVFPSMIQLSLRDPADLALIRRALMALPRMDPETKTPVMELLLHIHDTEEHKPDSTSSLYF